MSGKTLIIEVGDNSSDIEYWWADTKEFNETKRHTRHAFPEKDYISESWDRLSLCNNGPWDQVYHVYAYSKDNDWCEYVDASGKEIDGINWLNSENWNE